MGSAGIAALLTMTMLAACGPQAASTAGPTSAAVASPEPGSSPTTTGAPATIPAATPSAAPTAVPSPSPTVALPSFGQVEVGPLTTFVSKQRRYSIRHPESWIASSTSDEDTFLVAYGPGDSLLTSGARLTIRRGRIGTTEDLADVVRLVIKVRTEEFGCEPTTTAMKVDGRPAKLISCTDPLGSNGAYDVVVTKGSHFYLLIMTFDRFGGALLGLPDDLEMLRDVAASFRFR